MANNPYQSAVGDTDKEILGYAMQPESEDPVADAEEGDQLIAELSQVEGFDGEHVSDQEGMVRAIQGDDADPNYIGDRPLQYQHELAVDRENERLRALVDQQQSEYHALRQQFDPQFRAQQELNRAQFLDQHGLVAVDENRANNFLDQQAAMERQHMAQFQQRVNDSEAHARQEYGKAYDQAIEDFKQVDQNSSVAQNIKQLVLNSPRPAHTFMALMNENDVVQSLRPEGSWQPPFYQTRQAQQNHTPQRSAPRDQGGWPRDPDEQMSGGDDESEIWGSVWK